MMPVSNCESILTGLTGCPQGSAGFHFRFFRRPHFIHRRRLVIRMLWQMSTVYAQPVHRFRGKLLKLRGKTRGRYSAAAPPGWAPHVHGWGARSHRPVIMIFKTASNTSLSVTSGSSSRTRQMCGYSSWPTAR